jgi:hypothetical protein
MLNFVRRFDIVLGLFQVQVLCEGVNEFDVYTQNSFLADFHVTRDNGAVFI